LGGGVYKKKKSTEYILDVSKESGVEVNADKTNYRSCLEIRMQDEVTILVFS
jgi:hypothetical protein